MKKSKPSPPDALSATLAALADPTRRSILEQLSLGPATVTELAKPYAISQPAISKHLKVLEEAGLISQLKESQRRPRRLELARFKKAAEWMAFYSRTWEVRQNAFDPSKKRSSP
jgi:DNA-binding transcriptional ArsR family regulator